MNEKIYPVDEQQVSDMIENICAQTNQKASMNNQISGNVKHGKVDFDATPDQFKINIYEQGGQTLDQSQVRMRGLETSGMTYNKENIPVNKPYKKKGRPLGCKHKKQNDEPLVGSFLDLENKIESKEQRKAEREPFKPIPFEGQETDNALQESSINNQIISNFDMKTNAFDYGMQNHLLTCHQQV